MKADKGRHAAGTKSTGPARRERANELFQAARRDPEAAAGRGHDHHRPPRRKARRFAGDGAARREAADQRRFGAEDARRDRPAVDGRRSAVRAPHARKRRRQARHCQACRRDHRRRRIRHARHRHDDELPCPRTARTPPPDGRHQLVRHRPHARHRQRQQGLYGGRRVAQRFRRCLRRLGDRVRHPLQRQPCGDHGRRHRRRARRHGLCAGGGGVRPRRADARHALWSSPTTPSSAGRASSRSAASTASANSPPTSRRRATLPRAIEKAGAKLLPSLKL